MNILYIHQYFHTRQGMGGTRSFEFAQHLQHQGHRVTILAGSAKSQGGVTYREWCKGIRVIRTRWGSSEYIELNYLSAVRRLWSFFAFAIGATFAGLRAKADIVFATSTPLTVGIPGYILSRIKRVPLVFEVRDLWPEVPVQMGVLRNRILIALARWLEHFVCHHSAKVIALSPDMKEYLTSEVGMPPDRVVVIPNLARLDLFTPSVDGNSFREEAGLKGKFVVGYFGAMGEANGLELVVKAAIELQQRGERGVIFVLNGAGKERRKLERLCRDRNLANVLFTGPWPDASKVAQVVAAMDVCLVIFKDVPALATCSPNKLFDSLAAGKPVIVNTDGWMKKLVEQNQIGVYVPGDDPAALADAIIQLRDNPELVARMGERARKLAEEDFDSSKLAHQLEEVLLYAAVF